MSTDGSASPLESTEEGSHPVIYETENFSVCAYGRPFVSREEGGHIVIAAKHAVSDRTKLTAQQAKEYMRLSMMTGEAMETAMNRQGVPVVKINYADYGNWAFKKKHPSPHLHMHIFGRASDAKTQVFPEAVLLPARESGFYDSFQPLTPDDIKEIRKEISKLEHSDRYDVKHW